MPFRAIRCLMDSRCGVRKRENPRRRVPTGVLLMAVRVVPQGQTRSAAIKRYWNDPSLYELMNASSIPVTSEDVARSSQ